MDNGSWPSYQSTLTQYQVCIANKKGHFESLLLSRHKNKTRRDQTSDKGSVMQSSSRSRSVVTRPDVAETKFTSPNKNTRDFDPDDPNGDFQPRKKISSNNRMTENVLADLDIVVSSPPIKKDTGHDSKTDATHNSDDSEISYDLFLTNSSPSNTKSTPKIRQLQRANRTEGAVDEIKRIKTPSHYIEIPHDYLIRSFNLLHEKNQQLEHTVKNAKKEVRFLRRQLDQVNELSQQPSMSDIAAFQLVEDGEYDSPNDEDDHP